MVAGADGFLHHGVKYDGERKEKPPPIQATGPTRESVPPRAGLRQLRQWDEGCGNGQENAVSQRHHPKTVGDGETFSRGTCCFQHLVEYYRQKENRKAHLTMAKKTMVLSDSPSSSNSFLSLKTSQVSSF